MVLGPCSPKQQLILQSKAELLICGGAAGSGKSYLLLLMMLQYIDCPYWRGVIFRRTTTEIEAGGGLFDEAMHLYDTLPEGYKPKVNVQKLTFTFPHPDDPKKDGAILKLSHLQHHPKDTIKHHGAQYSLIAFDELTTFEEEQFIYMSSRLRSKSKYPGRIVCTCNPDYESFVLKYVEPYLDEDGIPRPEMDGVAKYIIRRGEEINWADSIEEQKEKFGQNCKPIHYEFISATIFDNPVLISMRPEYLAHLESLKDLDRKRLLEGSWYARVEGSSYFKREWLTKFDRIPEGIRFRGWDSAHNKPTEAESRPDFSACTGMVKTKDGMYVLIGDFHIDNQDRDLKLPGKFRELPGMRNQIMLKQAYHDGPETIVVLQQDPGGKFEFQELNKMFIENGFIVRKDPTVITTGKLSKYAAFSAACENGLVGIVESTFPPNTLQAFYKEHEEFNGQRSGRIYKDDWPDSTAATFSVAAQEKIVPIVLRNQINSPTKTSSVLTSRAS